MLKTTIRGTRVTCFQKL